MTDAECKLKSLAFDQKKGQINRTARNDWPPTQEPTTPMGGGCQSPLDWDWYAFTRVSSLAEDGQPIPLRQEIREEWEKYIGTFR